MNKQNPIFKRHFENPSNAGILRGHNCRGKDSSLFSGAVVIFYGLISKRKIQDISFRTFGCSHTIAASSLITVLAKGRDLYHAAEISEDDIEKELGIFPDNKKDSLRVSIGAFHDLLSSYIRERLQDEPFKEKENLVATAMSGGLDSSLAARLLNDKGYDVIGITMKIIPGENLPPQKRITSQVSSDIYSAGKVCRSIGIPHFVIDLTSRFNENIIGPFCSEYIRGRTPNPCVECNKLIKFGILLEISISMGAAYIATGHYCLVEKGPDKSQFTVKKGKDKIKEQSYVFWKLDQEQLSRIKTPLGSFTKKEVKKKAEQLFPFLKHRGESQDICFIDGGRYHKFLQNKIKDIGKGKILDSRGKHIGDHRGFPYYTIGQRRGLGISHPRPLYVLKIIPEKNILIAGEKEELLMGTATVKDTSFISGEPPSSRFMAEVKIRYNSPAQMAEVIIGKDNTAEIHFKRKVSSVTPGQSAVFYDGDIMLGGGIITG